MTLNTKTPDPIDRDSIDSDSIDSNSDFLVLDKHTFEDLEVFESKTEGMSLFEICDRTRTKGGRIVLRRRMAQPWSQKRHIQATHESIHFINKSRDTFSKLPSAFATNQVEKYTHDVLPIVREVNLLEFTFGAIEFWINQKRYYFDIVRGIQLTSGFILSLQRFISQFEGNLPKGEIAPLIEEMQTLLRRQSLSSITKDGAGVLFWKVLRLDQIFRLHETVSLHRLLQLNYEIDALVSMADATREHNFVLPTINSGQNHIRAEGIVHPFLSKAVENPIALGQEHRVLFLTGPNMAGKTTYLRTFATALYLAQLGMGVPAKSFCFVPSQKLFTSFSLSDDLQGGISYFRAEALRVKAVAQ
ncbi:MAG: DNA mismatch repair protein MutS, partial [Candidatus Azotimanducaceae bacterium]